MNFIVVATILLALSFAQARTLLDNSKTIENDVTGDLNSQVLVKSFEKDDFLGYCGGVVIHPRFVLVPYECIMQATNYVLVAGVSNIDDDKVDWLKPDCFMMTSDISLEFTIAMLIFVNPINNGDVVVAPLLTNGGDVVDGDQLFISSYQTYGQDTVISTLKYELIGVKGLDRAKCAKAYPPLVRDYQICYDSNDELCKVDFGSPVYLINGTVVGLTTFRDPYECSAEKPVVSLNLQNDFILGSIQFMINDNYAINCSAFAQYATEPNGVQVLRL